jgi:hypothetical protein
MHLRKLVRLFAVLNYLMNVAEDGPLSVERRPCVFMYKRSAHERDKTPFFRMLI